MKKNHLLLAIAILLIMCFQGVYFAWDTAQTIDETFYNGSGYAMVRYNDYQRLGEHPPLVMQLGSLPLLFLRPNYPYLDAVYLDDSRSADRVDLSKTGSKFLYEKGNNPRLILFLERIPVVLITLLGGFFLFKWGYELFGFLSALTALIFYAFSSNMIAHGSLFTTDMAVAIFFFLALYRTHRVFISSPIPNAVWAGFFSGLTLLSKMSGLILIPVIFLLFCIGPILHPELRNRSLKSVEPLDKFVSFLSPIFFLCAATQKLTAVALGPLCLVGGELTILRKMERNEKIQLLIRALLTAGWILLVVFVIRMVPKRPFPMVAGASLWCLTVFLTGRLLSRPTVGEGIINWAKLLLVVGFVCALVIIIDFTDNFASIGRFNFFRHYVRSFNIAFSHVLSDHKICIPGSFITCDWRYFLASILVKTPLTVLFLSALGLVILLRSKAPALAKAHLVLPPVIFLLVASFLNRINIGIRHILPVYPFLFLMAGIPACYLKEIKNKFLRNVGYGAISVLGLWVVLQNLSIAPHHLSYFSEWVGGLENGAKLDGSFNFGQDNRRLTEAVKKLGIPKIKIAAVASNAALYDYYGIDWDYLKEEDFVRPGPGYYAIDLTIYSDLQRRDDSWFKDKIPIHTVGKTFYIFKV